MRKLCAILCAFVVVHACSWDYPIWIPRNPDADPLYRFVVNEKAGYIDASGAVVIPPRFPAFGNGGGEFSNGLLQTGIAETGYVGRDGKVAIAKSFDAAWDFSNGLAAVLDKASNKWGFIDTRGVLAIPPSFPGYPKGYPQSFSEGMAAIEQDGAVGYVDKSGTFIIARQFLAGDAFRDGMARVVAEGPCAYVPDGPCGSFNLTVKPPNAKSEGNTPLCKYTSVNTAGKVLPQRFDGAKGFADAEPFSEGLARVGKYPAFGYIDRSGTTVIPANFKRADEFHDGLAPVSLDGATYFYINKTGARAIPGDFENASVFLKGLAHIEYAKGKFAYIRPSGERVFLYSSK